ncbi:MAG: hypothetical protein ABIN89_02330 [Chitinophagaceae bacterium]
MGVEFILKEIIRVNKSDKDNHDDNSVFSLDTTVQEKNITRPTDDKLLLDH